MPKILKPSDFATRVKAGETDRQIFYDAAGARVAKLIGLSAEVAAGGEDRSVDFAISTGALDRYNSTIAVKGWETDNFAKNPVVLWAHDDSIPAIGRAADGTRIEGGKLKSRAVFAERDVHELADTVYRLIKAGFISAASVGWIPLEWKFVEEEGRGFGIDYLRQELCEWSVVNIPANPECLVEARGMGIDTKPLLVWAERTLDQGGMLLIPRDELEALRKAAGAPTFNKPLKFQFAGAAAPDRARSAEAAKLAAAMAALGRVPEGVSVDDVAACLEAALDVDAVSGAPMFARAGKVLSAKTKQKIKDALDHCDAACVHMRNVLDSAEPDDGDEDPEHPETEADDDTEEERAARAQRLSVLKLKRGAAA